MFVYGPGFSETYEQYVSNFNRNIVTVEGFKDQIKPDETLNLKMERPAVFQSKPNEKEQERFAKIAEVNDMFERFKIDFMRDLLYNSIVKK